MRLIDADALADDLFDKHKNYPQWVADTIGNMPDAIVRCKDCKHYIGKIDGYCEKHFRKTGGNMFSALTGNVLKLKA